MNLHGRPLKEGTSRMWSEAFVTDPSLASERRQISTKCRANFYRPYGASLSGASNPRADALGYYLPSLRDYTDDIQTHSKCRTFGFGQMIRNDGKGNPLRGASSLFPRVCHWLMLVIVFAVGSGVIAQDRSLTERQQAVHGQIQQLETRMLLLTRLLAESEPDKVQRLREALDWCGQKHVKQRIERLAELLQTDQLSTAESEQEALLADLEAMLTRLADTANDFERMRAERERLEGFKRLIRALLERQLDQFYRTQTTQADRAVMRPLERRQRAIEREAADLKAEMETAVRDSQSTPGERQVGQARQNMQDAADRLAELQPKQAEIRQRDALEQLQRALDELDDALRQVRREELAETLTALEARFTSMLARQQQVLSAVVTLRARDVDSWTHNDQMRLTEAFETQQSVAEDCAEVARILVSEGTTVVLPELTGKLVVDMNDLVDRLDRTDVSSDTEGLLDQVIAMLAEIVAALEQRSNQELEQMMRLPAGGGPDDSNSALLRRSAELKLLRSAQLQINQRTLERAQIVEPLSDQHQNMLIRLAERQRLLVELARRMNERK